MLDALAGNLERYMDLLSARQKLVASNIANADTPGYKTRDIDFQAEFRNHVGGLRPNVAEVQGLEMKNDGNNVNVDRESRMLAENDLRFNLASQPVAGPDSRGEVGDRGGQVTDGAYSQLCRYLLREWRRSVPARRAPGGEPG